MILLGQVKNLDELKPLDPQEIKAFITGMEGYVKSETPLEIPVGISGNDLGRLTVTLRAFHQLVEKVAHVEAGIESPGMDQLVERWNDLQGQARDLLATKSRIIIPK